MEHEILHLSLSDTLKGALVQLGIPEHKWISFIEMFLVLGARHIMRSSQKCSVGFHERDLSRYAVLEDTFRIIQEEIGKSDTHIHSGHTYHFYTDNRTQIFVQRHMSPGEDPVSEFLDVFAPPQNHPSDQHQYFRKKGDLTTFAGLPQVNGPYDMSDCSKDEELSSPSFKQSEQLLLQADHSSVPPVFAYQAYPSFGNSEYSIASSLQGSARGVSMSDPSEYRQGDAQLDLQAVPVDDMATQEDLAVPVVASRDREVGEINASHTVRLLPRFGIVLLIFALFSVAFLLSFVVVQFLGFYRQPTPAPALIVGFDAGGQYVPEKKSQKKPPRVKKEVVIPRRVQVPTVSGKRKEKRSQHVDPWKDSIESKIW